MRAKHIFLGLAALAVVTGCGGAVTARGIAQVRAISAVTNPAAVDVFTDFNLVAIGLTNGVGGGYSSQTATFLSLGVRQTGTNTTLAAGNLDAGVDARYTIIPHQTGNNTVAIIALLDNAGTPAASKFKARLVHVDRNVGPVDLYFVDPGDDLDEKTPTITNLSFQNSSGYVELTAGIPKEIILTQAGTTTVVGNVVATTPAVGSVRTFMLLDNGSDPVVNTYSD